MKYFAMCALFLGFLCVSVNADLVHRYSFASDASDSVGTADGTLFGDAVVSGGALVLDGTDDWLELPGEEIAINTYTSATIEAWYTLNAQQDWQRVFDFGDTSGSSGGYYWFYCPSGSGGSRLCISTGGYPGYSAGEEMATASIMETETTIHLICVYDGMNQQMRIYQDGSPISSVAVTMLLADLHNTYAYIGKSCYPGDSELNGSIDELRIYNVAFDDTMAQASYQSGPETPIETYAVPSNPSPANGTQVGDLTPTLTWQSDPSTDITGHRVYLGTDYNTVLTATPATTGVYQGLKSPGNENFTPSTDLEMAQTYYWRIEEVTAGYAFSGPVWSFTTANLKASNPVPADGANGISTYSVTLQWTPGSGATAHRILFGTDSESLQVLESNYTSALYTVTSLDYETEYFWRIDEIYSTVFEVTGDVWSFTTREPAAPCFTGDLTGDCKVDMEDLFLFSQQWLASAGCAGFEYQCADFVGNDGVNQQDFAVFASVWGTDEGAPIVINEIHYHSDNNTEQVEFIELYNAGSQAVDLTGWYFEGAIGYTFPSIPVLNPGDYIVVTQSPSELAAKFGVTGYGPFEGKLSNEGEDIILRDSTGKKIDQVDYDSDFPWPVAANGEGASMELIHPSLDNDLAGSWRSSGFNTNTRPELSFSTPTPGAVNSIYAANAPPQIRQVNHAPKQPLSTEPITVTAKITDPDGVKRVYLKYQVVTPGNYIPAYLPLTISSLVSDPTQAQPLNPDFENTSNWVTVIMRDDGGAVPGSYDEVAGDGIYTYRFSAQTNRTLLRYRIEATDNLDAVVRVPYHDDPSLNFACFIYNGVPDYVTTDASVTSEGVGYAHSAEALTKLPVYTLITRYDDLYQCNGYNGSDQINQSAWPPNDNEQAAGRAYNWEGCFVYDGDVYDHISYRLRGGNGRYNNGAAGKRSMKFRFNRGNYFQARDIYGEKFPVKWQHLNTGKMFGNKIVWENYRHYPYGMNEVIDMKLFDLAGVPAPHTYWMHMRVIDGAEETPTTSGGQYNGDFWGLYVAFENYDGAHLDRLGLPKGNVYKLADKVFDGLTQMRYQGENAVDDASDYENIRWNLNHEASVDFIRNHLDCDEWYRYHTVIESIRSFDIFSGGYCTHCMKNIAWYFYPEYTAENNYLGKVQFMPFDVDDSWGPYFNYGIDHGKAAIYDISYIDHVLTEYTEDPEKAALKQEYRNYIREFRDLLWQSEVIDPMIAELAAHIADFVPADRDRWKEDPTPGGAIDHGTLEDVAALMYQFAWNPGNFYGSYYWEGTSSHLDNLAADENDSTNIPNTPTISYIGTEGYPENDLRFQTSAFSDPQGSGTFAAMKWRIAEVEPSDGTSSSQTLTLLDQHATWKYFKGTEEPDSGWNQSGFNDSGWLTGQTSIGFADDDDNTVLSDMRNNYSSVYLRNTFTVEDTTEIGSLKLHVYVDDGCIIYINGIEVARPYCGAGVKYYNSVTNTTDHEADWQTGTYEQFTLTGPYSYLVNGTNVIAVHALQVTANSSDFSIDVSITAETGGSEQTTIELSKKKYEINALWESEELTTFASDIRFPADGIKAGRTYRVRCKMKDTTGRYSHWSEPIEFVAGEALGTDLRDHLRITELMYNNGDAEFIELYNTGATTLDLAAVSLTSGVTFTFAGSAVETLAPGEYVLVIKDQDEFESQYGTAYNSRIAGTYSGSLSNGGENIKLEDSWDGTIAEFEYNDARGWPLAADGAGHSLVPLAAAIDPSQPFKVLNFGGNWRPSTYIGGSPAAADPAPAAGVVINEFMAHTDYSNPSYPDYDSNDWIELYNTAAASVSLNGNWYLSDDIDDLKKWALPSSTLAAGGRVSFDEITGFHNPISTGFGLDKAGEMIFLSYLPGTSADRVVDCIEFKGQANSVSMGRYPDGGDYWFSFSPATRGSANANVLSHAVISEFMYHPADGQEEFVEIYNPTGSAISLTATLPLGGVRGWALDGAVSYEFAAGTPALAAGAKILVVGFDPTDSALLDAFEAAYGTGDLTAGADIFGPWSGALSNEAERLTLEQPQDSDDPLEPLEVSWIIADECMYTDSWPWPGEADGTGMSMHRLSSGASASGSNPANWSADTPSPGM